MIAFTVIYAYIEATHDYYVIRNDIGYNDTAKKWHFWGMIQNALSFLPVYIILFMWQENNEGFKLMAISFLLFWQLHDSIIGWKFYRRVFYLGTHGFDSWLTQVFQNGRTVAIIRISIAFFFSYDYFRI